MLPRGFLAASRLALLPADGPLGRHRSLGRDAIRHEIGTVDIATGHWSATVPHLLAVKAQPFLEASVPLS